MKYTSSLSIVLLVVGSWAHGCGTGIAQNDGCSDTNPCREGLACLKNGTCVPAEAFAFSTENLGSVTVGTSWGRELRAEGGIQPYSWSMQSSLPWLQIDTRSGILSGTPDQAVSKSEVTVTVIDDSYGAGQIIPRTFLLTVSDCTNDSVQACFGASEGICYSGVQRCVDSVWASCNLTVPSASMEHCGSSCVFCESPKADRCQEGVCACGSQPACQDGQDCCNGRCLNLKTDVSNCGACDRDCGMLIPNVVDLRCEEGQCKYGACDGNYLDCDQNFDNGCETPISKENCGACSINCSFNTSNRGCVLNAIVGVFRCGCLDKSDCFSDEQCCGNSCVPSDDIKNCGGCGNRCGGATPACVWDGFISNHRCG